MFVGESGENLQAFLASRRRRTEQCEECIYAIACPGEYEIGGVLLNGMQTAPPGKARQDPATTRNVAFVVEMDDLRVCHLGDLDHTPGQDLIEEMSDIDVLFAPVGGHGARRTDRRRSSGQTPRSAAADATRPGCLRR